jgi:deoxyribodipyrimidine photo-lyase
LRPHLRERTTNTVSPVPAIRLRDCNDAPVRAAGRYVLYWMIASRRVHFNFALDRVLEYCRELGKPLVVLEALRCGYQWASDRMHRFVLDGMADNAVACAKSGVSYYPYVESAPGAGSGLLETLAADACVVVTDEFPGFFLPRMVAAATKIRTRLVAVDSNGLLPLRATARVFPTAHAFRRFLQKTLPQHLSDWPNAAPLSRVHLPAAPALPKAITSRWPAAAAGLLRGEAGNLSDLPIDHGVAPVVTRGGHTNACRRMKEFFAEKFECYDEERNEPELDVSSGLSPYLHFGHISVHEVFAEVARREKWNPAKVALRANGRREGWWNMSRNAEGFLDELITWREVGYNFAAHGKDFDRFESLPGWARKTLKEHARDEREHRYSLEEFEAAKTFDPLWNAAQTQLVREGRIHNYLRMLWGKKILEWSRSPKEALAILIQLNNKYALDGRDPNSYSGIFWCLGRYDRPWGPERAIFGKVRYMSSENTARKFSVKNYVRKYSS